jgi:hypothetical protein
MAESRNVWFSAVFFISCPIMVSGSAKSDRMARIRRIVAGFLRACCAAVFFFSEEGDGMLSGAVYGSIDLSFVFLVLAGRR